MGLFILTCYAARTRAGVVGRAFDEERSSISGCWVRKWVSDCLHGHHGKKGKDVN